MTKFLKFIFALILFALSVELYAHCQVHHAAYTMMCADCSD